jgi:dihydrofolate reductase
LNSFAKDRNLSCPNQPITKSILHPTQVIFGQYICGIKFPKIINHKKHGKKGHFKITKPEINMGKVISLINTTPDGFVDARYATPDSEFFEFTQGLLADTRTVAFGRNSFELFQNIWPPRLEKENANEWQVRMARALTDIPKAVYSSTLKTTTWNNSTIIQKIDAEHINSYKQESKGGLLTLGSLSLVAALIEMKLIDDYYFCIQPLIAGNGGVRLFDKVNLDTSCPLKYVDSKQLKSGVHIIHYQSVY